MVAGALVSFSGTVWVRSVIAVFEVVSAERVLEWAGISEASRGHAEADVLGKNARRNVHRERRHVRIDWHETLPRTLDVSGIIEQPLLLDGD